jgi:trk system potassium uptake protein TrkH
MNIIMILYIIGWILEFEAMFMLLPTIVGLIYREPMAALCYFLTAVITFAIGYFLKLRKPRTTDLYMREGFATVALGWSALSIFGAIPFVATGDIPNYINALFEAVSGFTTTGASILNDVEILTHAGLFWRSFTHWIGGMGVFVFIMSVLPLMGGSTLNLMRAESTGPSVGKLVPRVQDTAKILYQIYIFLTLLSTIVYIVCGLNPFDAICISFGTVGTGGYGILNTSVGSYSAAAQWAIGVFMVMAGINYSAYFYIIRRQLKNAFAIEEIRLYLTLVVAATLVIALNIRGFYPTFGEGLRASFFQVSSIITTTGYSTADFDLWPSFSKSILVALMFIGACSGSTAGGMKVSRILIYFKELWKELSGMVHPRQVKVLRMDGHVLGDETIRNTGAFLGAYFILFMLSTLAVSIDNFDFTTNFTAVAATLNNIGPGLGLVGPTCNYNGFSIFSKFVLMLDMLAGRLELFPILILFKPGCWKKY